MTMTAKPKLRPMRGWRRALSRVFDKHLWHQASGTGNVASFMAPPSKKFGGVYVTTPSDVLSSKFDLEALARRTARLRLKTAVEAAGHTYDDEAVRDSIVPYRADPETGELVETSLLRGDATELHYRSQLVAPA